MADESLEPMPPPVPLERIRRPRQTSIWPVLIVVGFVVAAAAAGIYMLLQPRVSDQPWRIDYKGITWLRGTDSNLREGKRYLEAEIRFDLDTVAAADFEPFLSTLVARTKTVYAYYHIRAQNGRGQHVLDGVARNDGTYSITPGPEYNNQ